MPKSENHDFLPDGTVTSPVGFRAGGMHAGFRKEPGRFDMALVEGDELCTAAGVFTTNVFCAAPVIVCREHLNNQGFGTARAIVVNSGIANAATGQVGMDNARESAEVLAQALGCAVQDVLVASTGIIGQQLDISPFREHAAELHQACTSDVQGGHDAARAMMTTDTVPKECAIEYTSTAPGLSGATLRIGGMVKGAGMIMPNMATMISILTTDAPLEASAAHAALKTAVDSSFNKLTVDSDTSTNDSCFLLASGKAAPGADLIKQGSEAYFEFVAALQRVCENLARQMAADGEGATRLVTVNITGAADEHDADLAARAIANSPLVKTAIAGHDANWGRIAAAAGRSGAKFKQEDVDIDIMGIPVLRSGLPVPFDEDEALRRFEQPEIVIDVNLGAGEADTTMWTCDFTHDYISINGDYRS